MNKNIISFIKGFLIGFTIITLFLSVYLLGAVNSNKIIKSFTLDNYRDIIINNDLELIDNCINNHCESDLNIYNYSLYVKENYYYDDLHDCKYWAFNWALYLEKNNINYQFVFQENKHVFVIAYTENSYYLLDGNIFEEIKLI